MLWNHVARPPDVYVKTIPIQQKERGRVGDDTWHTTWTLGTPVYVLLFSLASRRQGMVQ